MLSELADKRHNKMICINIPALCTSLIVQREFSCLLSQISNKLS